MSTCAGRDLKVETLEVEIPLSSLEEEDASAAKSAPPELMVEFYGDCIRAGYNTPRLTAQLHRDSASEQSMLRASFPSSMALPVTDLSHKMGPQRMVRSHVVIQLVALFGARRVSLGASVISMDRALGEVPAKLKCSLTNCGVLTGG